MNYTVDLVKPEDAQNYCQILTQYLPEWFGIPEANERYAEGMLSRISIAAICDNQCIGMVTLEFPYPNNANIFWMAVQKGYQGKQIGTRLIIAAENYARQQGANSLTVETLSPKQGDRNYLKTFRFYEKMGFRPLFEMNTYGPENLLVYLQKAISLADFTFVDLTHELSAETPNWAGECGFEHTVRHDYADSKTATQFRGLTYAMLAGIGTHMDAPLHCFANGLSVAELTLNNLIAPCVVIDVSAKADENYLISVQDILDFEKAYDVIDDGTCVLFHTGWQRYWYEPEQYRNNLQFPSISKEAAALLLTRNIKGVGIDTLSPDCPTSDFPVHELLLSNKKYILENITNANYLPPVGAYTFALPIKVKDGTEAPIRLIGMKQ